MKLTGSILLILCPLVTFTSAWKLRAGSQEWTGSGPHPCTTVHILKGTQIAWHGSTGASTLQVFTTGNCARVYRTVQGIGEINASEDIYAFDVRP